MKLKHLQLAVTVLSLLIMGTQPALGTRHIPGDLEIGTWDENNRIYTLTTHVDEGAYIAIQIDQDNLTVNGDKYSVMGAASGTGIHLPGRTGVILKDVTVQGFTYGISLEGHSTNNTLTGITATDNNTGIKLLNAHENVLTGNITNSNVIGINVLDSIGNHLIRNIATDNITGIRLSNSHNSTLTGNTTSSDKAGTTSGINLSRSHNNTLNSNITHSLFAGINLHTCSGNDLDDNTVYSNRYAGIFLFDSSDNTVINNNASDNSQGIAVSSSSYNELSGNMVSNSNYGIILGESSNNILGNNTTVNSNIGIYIHMNSSSNVLIGNTVNTSANSGIALNPYCDLNVLTHNTVSNNSIGIMLGSSDDNQIYNNNFIDNAQQASVGGSSGNVFNLDRPVGGNYWSDWTTPDKDSDGFVDFPYVFTDGQDDLPWAEPDGWNCRDPGDMIQELADQVMALNLQHGISNSLDAKLDAALQAHEDINENNDIAAINTLEAFINAVEAQRGSKITEADADALINKAQRIIDCLTST